jgi:hypothetical protein
MLEPVPATCRGERFGAVGRAVVGHDACDLDTQRAEPGKRPVEEGDGARVALVAQDLDGGKPRGVVDGDVSELPASTAGAVPAIASDAVTDPLDPAELLDVEVEELAGRLALVAPRRLARVERREGSIRGV